MIQIKNFLDILDYEGTPKEIKDNIKFNQNLGVYVMCEDVGSYFGDDDESYDIEAKKVYRQIKERKILDSSKLSKKNKNPLKVFSVITSDGYVIGSIETQDYSSKKDISSSKIIQAVMNELGNRELFNFVLGSFYQNKLFLSSNLTEEEERETRKKISDKVLDFHDQFLNPGDLLFYDNLGLYLYKYPYPTFIENDFNVRNNNKDVYEYTIFDENAKIFGQFNSSDDNYFSFPSESIVKQVIEKDLKNGSISLKKEIIKNFLNNEKSYSDLCLGIADDKFYEFLGE